MKLIKDTQKITEYVSQVYQLDDKFTLHVEKTNGKLVSCVIKAGKKEYFYVEDGEKFREFFRNHPYWHKDFKALYSFFIRDEKLFKHIEKKGFDRSNVFFDDHGSHNIKDSEDKWIDLLVVFDYISGFSQNSDSDEDMLKWRELEKHLKKHPNVRNLVQVDIPYYNLEFKGQKGFEFDVLVPESWRNYGKDGWDTHSITRPYGKLPDPLGVKKFLKS